MDSIVLVGAGKRCAQILSVLDADLFEVLAVIDSNPQKIGENFNGYFVESFSKAKKYKGNRFCITPVDCSAVRDIRKSLICDNKFSVKDEITYDEVMIKAYLQSRKIREFVISLNRRKDDEKRTILFDCTNGMVLGGVESWTKRNVEELIKRGHENIFVITDKTGRRNDVSATVEKLIVEADINRDLWLNQGTICNLIEIIMENEPCTVVTAMPDELMLASGIVRKYYPDDIRICAVVHNSFGDMYEKYNIYKQFPDLFVCCSYSIKETLEDRRIAEKECYVMTCPFDCEEKLTRDYSKIGTPIRIGYAGRIANHQKRMDLIIKLIERLIEKKINFKLELAGEGSEQEVIEKTVRNMHAESMVSFLGRIDREDIPSFWRRQDLYINLADFEGHSISQMEAMGAGCVPVVTHTSGVDDDIVDGFNGFIVPIGAYNDAVDKICFLDKNRNLLPIFGKKAHDAVYPNSFIDKHIDFIEDIIVNG